MLLASAAGIPSGSRRANQSRDAPTRYFCTVWGDRWLGTLRQKSGGDPMVEGSTMSRNQSDMAHVTAGRVRVGPLRHLPEVLRGFGIPLDPLLDGLGLPADLMENPENTIAVAAGAALLALCAQRTRCP